MRKALNENPMVQIGVLTVCGVIFAVILFTDGQKDEPATDAARASRPTTATTATTPAPRRRRRRRPPIPPTALRPPDAGRHRVRPRRSPPAPAVPPGTPPTACSPSKGLPEDVLVAFAKNETIALLVIDRRAISDKQVEQLHRALRSRDDVEVFVVDVKQHRQVRAHHRRRLRSAGPRHWSWSGPAS